MFGRVITFAMAAFILMPEVIAQTPPPSPRSEPHLFSFSWDSDGGYLGIQTEEVTRDNFGKFGLRDVRGVAVAKVIEGSPAAEAGVQDGDVIVKLNSEAVTSTKKLTRLVSEISPDHTARLTVVRGGSEREISVTVGRPPGPKFGEGSYAFPEGLGKFEMPEMPKMPELEMLEKYRIEPRKPGEPMVFSLSNRRQIGVGLTPLTKQLSDHFGVTNGALVNTVREDSPAAKAGLKAGDIITQIDGKAVNGELDVVRAISEKKDGDVSLTYVRDGRRNTVRVTPEESKDGFFEHFEWQADPAVPDEPAKPNVFKLQRPGTLMTPMPLSRSIFRGRIV